jgi:hypothetical protein
VKMVYVLFAAVAAGAAVGGARSLGGSPSTPSVDQAPIAAESPSPAAPAGEAAPAAAAVEGEVLEVIEVPNYSYLRIGQKGSEGTWAAVPTAGLEVGDRAAVRDGMEMSGFTSTALKRTFPVIYFGTLAGGAAPHAMGGVPAGSPHANGADPHASAAANPHANGADPHADGAGADPHAAMGGARPAPTALEVKPVDKAKGTDGRTVAEVIGQRTKLAGKTVRIHATVVKSTPGIMGKTYLHLRDGSGDAAAGTNDVTVTTATTPAVGDVILVEGTVGLDRDIGSGYKFPTIVEDATVLPAP